MGDVVKGFVGVLVCCGLFVGGYAPEALAGETEMLVRQVLDQASRDHYADAERMAQRDPLLLKLVRWKDYSSANPTGDFSDITTFIDANPDWPLLAQVQKRAEAQITAATPPTQVLAWFQAHPPLTPDGGMALARAYASMGQNEKSAEVARRTWVEGNFGAMQERQFLAQFSDALRPEDHWRRLDRLLWDKNQSAARGMLLRVDLPHRQLAQARIALQEDKGGADGAVNTVPARYRDDPGLIYDRVRWRRQHDMNEDAIDLLSHPARNQVRPDLWWQERGILARWALQRGWISRAYQVASDNGLAPDSPQAVDAEFLSGWISLRYLSDWETAQLHFRKVLSAATTSVSKARGAYWLGRAAEAAGNADDARLWYTTAAQMVTTYYGQLAATRLSDHHWPLPQDPAPTPDDVKRFKARELVRAVSLLAMGDDTDAIRPFLIRLNETVQSSGERTMIAQLAAEYGRKDLGLAVARKADRDGVTLVSAGWPTLPIADDGGVEKALILSVIRQESGFNADAESSAGAKGLMQLLPSTAAKVAHAIRVAFAPRKLGEPGLNIRLGAAYLDSLLEDFQGSYILTLAAYNAGPARARRWVKDLGDPRDPSVDVVDWIESIPFTETRHYVQRVMEGVEIYRRRLGLSPGNGLEADLRRWAKREAG
jgi:soluble lytic murein transglycosylase